MPERSLKVLVIDDEPAVREVLSLRIADWGFDVLRAGNGAEAQGLVARDDPDLVVSDVVLPDISGLELLQRLRNGSRSRPVILITAHGSIDTAVEAMKEGAHDFLTKPLDHGKLRSVLEDAAREVRLRDRVRRLEARLDGHPGLGHLVGRSPAMQEVFGVVEQLARSDASALLTGESGTGKEVVARTVHALSARADGPFIALNTAAIPDGLIESELFGHEKGAFTGATHPRPGSFEMADGGTLLLDEIAEMSPALQPRLLRVLEEGAARRLGGTRSVSFDVRVLAATNREPEEAIADGRLREDLLYRLNVFTIRVPPLREHPGDIPLLVQHFLREYNEKHGCAVDGARDETLDLLRAYDWPGNVRELRNVVERSTIVAREGWLEPAHLPPYLRESHGDAPEGTVVLPMGISAAEAEKRLILRTLDAVGRNKAAAARTLGLDVKTIRNKLKAWGRD